MRTRSIDETRYFIALISDPDIINPKYIPDKVKAKRRPNSPTIGEKLSSAWRATDHSFLFLQKDNSKQKLISAKQSNFQLDTFSTHVVFTICYITSRNPETRRFKHERFCLFLTFLECRTIHLYVAGNYSLWCDIDIEYFEL